MKRIAAITFHSPYNYGANLQAYALQEFVTALCGGGAEYKIINLRTDAQRDFYRSSYERGGLKSNIKKLVCFRERQAVLKKKELFEDFINNRLSLTEEFKTEEQLNNADLDFDYYICGSDQIWNTLLRDFEWSYFLEFVGKGKRISYSASFGSDVKNTDSSVIDREKTALAKFEMLSVRESAGADRVEELTGKRPEIHIDPTMLLKKADWEKIIPTKPIIDSDYILLYYIRLEEDVFRIAKAVSKTLKMPVIVTKKGSTIEKKYGFKHEYAVGPIEFLNLVKNARLVLSSSFHGTVFSALLGTPFFAINGSQDLRISNLLRTIDLAQRTVNLENVREKCATAFEISFDGVEERLDTERKKAEQYLRKALEISDKG